MLERAIDALVYNLKGPEAFLPVPDCECRDVWAQVDEDINSRILRRADDYARAGVPALTASAYMAYRKNGDLSGYPEAYRTRRDMLRTFVLALCLNPTENYNSTLCDLIWSICEETSWVLPANNPCALGSDAQLLPDPFTPLVDSAAAETAADLALAVRMIGPLLDEITPQLVRRMVFEVRARVVDPMSTYREMEWACGPHSELTRCLAGAMTALLALEDDGRRRWGCLRKALGQLDRMLTQMPQDGSITEGVSAWLDTADPIVDCLMMIYHCSQGAVDVRREPQLQLQLMCHFPVLCHLAHGWFINPGSSSMRPPLDGEAMMRIGVNMHDEALCSLGSFLVKTDLSVPSEHKTLWHEVQTLLNRAALEGMELHPPFRREGYLPGWQMMTARTAEDDTRGLSISIHGGHNGLVHGHADAGDFTIFAGGKPIVVDGAARDDSLWHNLPSVGGVGQGVGASYRAEDAVCELEENYALMSLNLAPAYPQSAGLYSWQRTLVFSRSDGTVQLMEVFDLNNFYPVEFHFILGVAPRLGSDFVQIGPVRMRWGGGLVPSVEEIPALPGTPDDMLWRLTLTTEQPVNGGQYTFSWNALRTFG